MNFEPDLKKFESKFLKFDSLMQHRVKNVLLVSSLYDSFVLEEDGKLTDLIYSEYLDLNLTVTPNVKRATNAREALTVVEHQDIDLIIVFKRVSDIDVVEFSKKARELRPKVRILLLAYNERDLEFLERPEAASSIDKSFIWTGDVRILLSMIKLVEDARNCDHDTDLVGVRVIIIVEDSVRFYSSYLPLVYTEIMKQTRQLMAEGLNLTDRVLRMRARPKILLAQTYDEAVDLISKYKEYLLAVISDFRFPRHGVIDDEAGAKLIDRVREDVPDIPLIMQSSNIDNYRIAKNKQVGFLYKHSPTLHNDLSAYIKKYFGFGDFSFTLPDGTLIAKAGDFRSMEKCLSTVVGESLLFHGRRNHFSNWLMARGEFDLASRLRPRKVSEFEDVEVLRKYLIQTFRSFRHEKQLGVISDFSSKTFDLQSDFVRIGGGSLGGKGRGLAFINALLNRYNIYTHFEGTKITVPASVILGTDCFDDFIEDNNLLDVGLSRLPDAEIAARFLEAKLPDELLADLSAMLEIFTFPLAVRSSSLLEDSHQQPYAGVYDTLMLLNSDPSKDARLMQLEAAIKMVFASTFFENAKYYHESTGNRVEEEKMAVIIQQAVGQHHQGYYYPSFSGAALSYNYYSSQHTKPEDGIVNLALGFGKTIVEGLSSLAFSPADPTRPIQYPTTKDLLKNSQKEFYALDMQTSTTPKIESGADGLSKLTIVDADKHGTLAGLSSTYSPENDRLYTGVHGKGIKVISFAPILKSKVFPLVDICRFIMKLGAEGLNCPVEIEFAVNLNHSQSKPDEFYFLQIRPMMKDSLVESISIDDLDQERIILKSEQSLGNLLDDQIYDIIYVHPDRFERGQTVRIAEEIGQFNKKLKAEHRPYLLIGPGRWGSSERWLGIPAKWNQISGAAVIVESGYGDFAPEPSFGSHFLQNIISFQIGYLTVNESARNGFVNWDWLKSLPPCAETTYVTHVQTDKALKVRIDGRAGQAAISR